MHSRIEPAAPCITPHDARYCEYPRDVQVVLNAGLKVPERVDDKLPEQGADKEPATDIQKLFDSGTETSLTHPRALQKMEPTEVGSDVRRVHSLDLV